MSYDPDHRVSCATESCYATINLAPKDYKRLKRTGETFYCPAGHLNYYPGKTEEQKEIDALTRDLRKAYRKVGEASGQRDLLVSLIRRCPVCAATPGRHVRIYRDHFRFEDDVANVRDWMAEHLRAEHGVEVEVRDEAS